MRLFQIGVIAVLQVGCASGGPRRGIEIIGQINASTARVISKKNAEDGSRSSGIVAYFRDDESAIAQATAEHYCGGPVRIKSEDYTPTGNVSASAVATSITADLSIASTSADQQKSWKMVFDCNKSPSPQELAAYKSKFEKLEEPGIGDMLFGGLGVK